MTPYQAEHHSCGQHHYGRMDVVRECCVEAAAYLKRLAQTVAFTASHPAVAMFHYREAALSDAEIAIVQERVPGSPSIYGRS